MSSIVRGDGGPTRFDVPLYVLSDRPCIQHARPGIQSAALHPAREPASMRAPLHLARAASHPARAAQREARAARHPEGAARH